MNLAHEHVRAFLDDAASVLRSMVGTQLARRIATDERVISILVRARGALSGFTWTFSPEVAERVATHLVPGTAPDPQLCEAAASELANMLTGRGLQTLAERGLVLEIEPPELSRGGAPGATYVVDTDVGVVSVTIHS